ncbi:MAG TPA: hypothetical protein PLD62_05825, partial [Candidatus Cloacimonadota bacterium]|nr:hypothetical protein [Candidatus Cloacimonadota bacterium]
RVELNAFKYVVYWEIQEVQDNSGIYAKLHSHLQEAGTPNLVRSLKRLAYEDMLNTCRDILAIDLIRYLLANWQAGKSGFSQAFEPELKSRLESELSDLATYLELTEIDITEIVMEVCENLQKVLTLKPSALTEEEQTMLILSAFLAPLSDMFRRKFGAEWYHESLLRFEIEDIMQSLPSQLKPENSSEIAALGELMNSWQNAVPSLAWWNELLSQPNVNRFLQINRFENKDWFRQEPFEALLHWMQTLQMVWFETESERENWQKFREMLSELEKKSEFQIEKLRELINEQWHE